MELSALGLDNWFQAHARELCSPGQTLARVVAADRGRYVVNAGAGEFYADLPGKFFYAADTADRFPCVGDWICLEHHESDEFASIHAVLPRKTLLKRKTVGYDEEFQLLAANIDVAFIVMACDYDFHISKLERFLVMVYEADIKPVLLLSKSDLISHEALQRLLADIRTAGIATDILPLSNVSGEGIAPLRALMHAQKTYCLLGSSGVGKSSLMNRLIGSEAFETQAVSDSGQGKHTTVRRHLIQLEDGAMLIDMPGMRELAVAEVRQGMEDSFADIVALAANCRFSNCTHGKEPDCAIRAALANHSLSAGHYENYLKIQMESLHHKKESPYVVKRRKARNASRIAPTRARQKKLPIKDSKAAEDHDDSDAA